MAGFAVKKGARLKNLYFSGTSFLVKTRFTEFIIRENALDERGFEEWIFLPGMLFNSMNKWWADYGKRKRAHEGLDLCLYRDQRNRLHRLDEKTKIPVMYDGIVVRILNDFLGKSVIVEHGLPGSHNGKFCTVYGHTSPVASLRVGRIVKQGDIIATLAESSRSKTNVFSHLHISLGRKSESISYDELDWETLGATDTLTLMDPMLLIGEEGRTLTNTSPMLDT